MIQFNLLPDVKIEHIKTKRNKRFIILLSAGVSGALLTVMILLFLTANVFQKKHLSDLNNDIKKYSAELKGTKDIDKVLTVQNQLNNLPTLHDSKPVATRVFDYLTQVTPDNLGVASIDINFEIQTITMKGGADALSTVNKFVDTLKFTDYTIESESIKAKAFKDVVLSNFGKDDKGATYTVDFKFDPLIFDSSKVIKLVVPNIITTRSETQKPTDLFQPGGSGQITGEGN